MSEKQVLSHCCLQCLTVEETNHCAGVRAHHKDTGGTLFSANMPAELEVNAEMEVTFLSGSLRQLPVKHDVMRLKKISFYLHESYHAAEQRAMSSRLPV